MPIFRLIDPLKRFSASAAPVEEALINDIWDTDEDDHMEDHRANDAVPRISVPGYFDIAFTQTDRHLANGPINAKHMIRRLLALSRALENLSREARRLVRWQARRPLALQQRRPMRLTPLRPGRPPGFRLRPTHEVDHVLRECHALALDRMVAPDSS